VLFGLLLCLPCLAADFKLEDMQGKTHSLSDYRGKWVLVNFWATWCPPCLAEIPELKALANSHKDLAVIGIAMEYGSAKIVADFVKKQHIAYPIVLGNRKIVSQIGDLDVLPTSYLYSPTGELVSSQQGELTRASVESYIKSRQGK
jgi:thiol-disulfide isomerase/thioredoxin